MSAYSDEIMAEATQYGTLGPEYFAAGEAAKRFLAHWREEHAEQLAEAIMKPVLDAVTEKVWDAFRDYLLADAELNAAGAMRDMVERSVRALIGGEKWANVKYIEYPHREGQKVREALAKLYSDEIKDGRIADLEKEVASLKESLMIARGQY